MCKEACAKKKHCCQKRAFFVAKAPSKQERIQVGIAHPKILESNFIHHDFVQFGKQHIKTNSE